VATLAPVVFQAAKQGDTVAAGIMDYAARELAALVFELLGHFGVDERQPVEVAANGGLLHPDEQLFRSFATRLKDEPRIRLLERMIEPAMGAIWLGRNG